MPNTNGHGSQASERVALYLRVSSEEQRDRETIEIQREFLKEYCRLYGLEAAQVYADDGVSGTISLHERPEGRRLLEDAKQDKFSTLLVCRLDRLGRSLLVIVDAHDRLQYCGVALKSATEPIDTSNPSGRLIFQMLASFAEYERETIRERTRSGLHRAYRNGKYTGRIPYGYRLGSDEVTLVVVEEEAAVVREIIANVSSGSTLYSESKRLNESAVPSPGWRFKSGERKHGRSWSPSTVAGIVHQPAYSGIHEVKIGGEDTITREVPVIVDRALQERARVVLAENKRYPNRKNDRKYLLRGMLRCEICGYACTGRTSSSAGRKYSYYGCISNRAERRSPTDPTRIPPHRGPSINASWLEDLVWRDIREFLENPGETLERVREQLGGAHETEELEARRRDLAKRLAAKQAEKDRYVRLYAGGHLDEEELETYLLDLKNQIGNLRLLVDAAEADLSQEQETSLAAKTTEAWLLALRERTAELEEDTEEAFEKRRALTMLLVEKIDLGRDEAGSVRARITYRFGPPGGAGDTGEKENGFVGGIENSFGNLAAKRNPSGETSRQFCTVERRGIP
jgi:site-specific DNA recombinase